jgi:hypothetical protein
LREEAESAFDLGRINSESVSNEIGESEMHDEKHSEQKFEHKEELQLI